MDEKYVNFQSNRGFDVSALVDLRYERGLQSRSASAHLCIWCSVDDRPCRMLLHVWFICIDCSAMKGDCIDRVNPDVLAGEVSARESAQIDTRRTDVV